MKFRESLDYARRHRKVPAHIVFAFETPEAINSVILFDSRRARIVKELTREEFDAAVSENRKKADHVSVTGDVFGARLQVESAEDVAEVPEGMRYFYAAELI